MNSEEYENLANLERNHWFYRGKREIVSYWLRKNNALSLQKLLVDVGAGSGFFASQMQTLCKVIAVDDHQEALQLCRLHLSEEQILQGDCNHIPLPDGQADIVTALDVLEHVEYDARAVTEIARILKPGGVFVATVPALQSLWSDWDVALHHFRRYQKESFLALFDPAIFEVFVCQYINVVAMPIVFSVRWLRSKGILSKSNRMEDKIPPPWLNGLLRFAFVWLACQKVLQFPFGVGLIAVVRKR